MRTYRLLTLAGILGLTGVVLGAFGAHFLKERLAAAHMTDTWETGIRFQLFHATAVLALALAPASSVPAKDRWRMRTGHCWALGVLFFSGSLYGLALGGPRILGPITPLGGILLMVGWLFVMLAGIQAKREARQP